MKAEYPRLNDMAIKTLLPFPSTYLCKVGFSTLTYLKEKCNNYALLPVTLSSIEPQLDKLIEKKQAHTSHQRIKIKAFLTLFMVQLFFIK